MGESARDGHYSAAALRTAIADVLRDGGLPAATRLALRTAALSGLCIVSLVPAAGALSLGELEVRSRLGEPLQAQLPLTLGPGESLAAGCISQGRATDDLARLPQLRIQAPVAGQAGAYTVRLSTPRPLHEPMYGIELRVACPGTPVMVRQYVLMLDLPGAVLPVVPATVMPREARSSPPAAARSRPAPAPATAPQPAVPRTGASADRMPIAQGSNYRVAAGDTLSLIAQRVARRNGIGIWDMAALIQQANPSAFINGNPDLIRLGSELEIPVLAESPVPVTRTTVEAAPATVAPPPLPAEPAMGPATPVQAAGVTTVAAPGPSVTQPAAEAIARPPAPGTAPEAAAEVESPAPLTPALPAALPTALSEPAVTDPLTTTPRDAALLAPAAPTRRGANPLLASAIGIGVGLFISLLFGRFSVAGLRRGQAAATTRRQATYTTPENHSPVGNDPGITVVESPAQEDAPVATATATASPAAAIVTAAGGQAAAKPLAGLDWRDLDEDITDELSALFGDEDLSLPGAPPAGSTARAQALPDEDTQADHGMEVDHGMEMDDDMQADDTLPTMAIEQTDLDSLDPSSTAEVSGLDWDTLDVSVGDALDDAAVQPDSDENEPAANPVIAREPAARPPIDLPALAASATNDEKLSESLIEALKLLEQDYQQEMTATQLSPMVETATEQMSPVIEGDTAEHPAPLKRQGVG